MVEGVTAMRDGRMKLRDPGAASARALLDRWIVRGRITQTEAADVIGISRVKLNQYLHGDARPSLETAIRIEDATGIGVRLWLLDDAPDLVGAGVSEANESKRETG